MKSDTTEWRRMHYPAQTWDKAQSPKNCWVVCRISLAKVSGHCFLSLWRGVCEFSILIPEWNWASPCLENHWGIKARSITPCWTVRPFYMWLGPSCSLAGNREERRCETLSEHLWHVCVRGKLMILWTHQWLSCRVLLHVLVHELFFHLF